MTDKVIKALKICTSEHLGCEDGCPYILNDGLCVSAIKKDALDLINRQQAKIERLKEFIEKDQGLILHLTNVPKDEYDNKIKADAIKEFENKLRAEAHPDSQGFYIVLIDQITALEKKMAGDTK